jgi:hypothetical protein
MDTELLVDSRIEDGQKLVAELVIAGFDVSVAFWAKTSEEGLWFLYIGSTSVEPSKIGDAYRTLYACLSRIPDPWVGMSEVMLIQATTPSRKTRWPPATVNRVASPSAFRANAWAACPLRRPTSTRASGDR